MEDQQQSRSNWPHSGPNKPHTETLLHLWMQKIMLLQATFALLNVNTSEVAHAGSWVWKLSVCTSTALSSYNHSYFMGFPPYFTCAASVIFVLCKSIGLRHNRNRQTHRQHCKFVPHVLSFCSTQKRWCSSVKAPLFNPWVRGHGASCSGPTSLYRCGSRTTFPHTDWPCWSNLI